MESSIGLENDGVIISENFKDFELDSTSVIRNLQVVFVFLMVLMMIPVILIMLFGIFHCSTRCKKWLHKAAQSLFWNTYIRFWLESYLEFSIASLIRLRKFNFESWNDIFNSVFATTLLITLVFLLVGSVPLLHCKPLRKEPASPRYSELTLGLRTHKRCILFSPTFFMMRRLFYAYILVNWSERSIE